MSHTPQPGIIIQMMEARQACRDLMGLMVEENNGLTRNSTHEVETRLQLKKRLALRLEKLLADIKSQRADFRGNREVENLAVRLAEEIAVFQDIAAKNELMLRAAHRLRADVVAVIRDTIEASQPRVQTYNAHGASTVGTAGTTVVATTV
ncbi:MAG: hypothetical protein H6922_03680 [Pseudomonadaceae bacterium]|nr:hypothetical protein [Pseudomonadaceae bacterium]